MVGGVQTLLVEFSPSRHEVLDLISSTKEKKMLLLFKPGIVLQASNPSTQEAEEAELSLRPTWSKE